MHKIEKVYKYIRTYSKVLCVSFMLLAKGSKFIMIERVTALLQVLYQLNGS